MLRNIFKKQSYNKKNDKMINRLKTYVSTDNKEYQLKYSIGDSVYLKTDNDQLERLVTGILIRENGVMFELSQSNTSSYHFSFEIARDRNVLKVSTS